MLANRFAPWQRGWAQKKGEDAFTVLVKMTAANLTPKGTATLANLLSVSERKSKKGDGSGRHCRNNSQSV